MEAVNTVDRVNAASPDGERDWKSEAAELRGVVLELRRRLLALARILPADSLDLLEADLETLESTAEAGDLNFLDDFEDHSRMVVSDVAIELKLLWSRIAVRGGA